MNLNLNSTDGEEIKTTAFDTELVKNLIFWNERAKKHRNYTNQRGKVRSELDFDRKFGSLELKTEDLKNLERQREK